MHWARAAAVLITLAGCSGPVPPAPPDQVIFRAAGASFASSTRFDAARMAGEWRVVGAFATAAGRLPPVTLRLAAAPGGMAVTQGAWMLPPGPYAVTGPGRLVRADTSKVRGPEVWVIWVDDDFRTAVMGSPDERLAWIMDRARISPDRLRAARDILQWQGYDMTRLRMMAD